MQKEKEEIFSQETSSQESQTLFSQSQTDISQTPSTSSNGPKKRNHTGITKSKSKNNNNNQISSTANPASIRSGTDSSRNTVREEYRKLISQTTSQRQELLQDDNKFSETIEAANELFSQVDRPREGVMDAEFMGQAAQIYGDKISQIQGGEKAWRPAEFIGRVVRFLKVEGEDEEDAELNWNKLDSFVTQLYHRTPSSSFL